MLDIIQREAVYLWYYFDLQLRQIFWYWLLGMLIGSAVSVFLKDRLVKRSWAYWEFSLQVLSELPLRSVCTVPYRLPPPFQKAE